MNCHRSPLPALRAPPPNPPRGGQEWNSLLACRDSRRSLTSGIPFRRLVFFFFLLFVLSRCRDCSSSRSERCTPHVPRRAPSLVRMALPPLAGSSQDSPLTGPGRSRPREADTAPSAGSTRPTRFGSASSGARPTAHLPVAHKPIGSSTRASPGTHADARDGLQSNYSVERCMCVCACASGSVLEGLLRRIYLSSGLSISGPDSEKQASRQTGPCMYLHAPHCT